MSAIGMMEGAYFVSRVELLNWLNHLLQLDYTKVEQVCSAAAFCQVMDAIYPGQVPLSKVKFNATLEYEFVNNFKVLQNIFQKFNIDRYIDVEKLIKGKYQDNLEFLQWIKRYYDLHNPGGEYNAIERRAKAGGSMPGDKNKKSVSVAQGSAPPPGDSPIKPPPAAAAPAKKPAAESNKENAVKAAPAKATRAPAGKVEAKSAAAAASSTTAAAAPATELQKTVTELRLTIDALEKERDFYFSKLRDIEIAAQEEQDQEYPFVKKVTKILYATDDADEFVSQELQPAADQGGESY
eukprot:TRINITY_DN5943_c0_g1_i1.p1 TRINITY_DN5943_c0_g1~~TRINITY_DN5943_c0_g1_i1.p1  ORF type:complete len:339 (-),score=82.53 TRINITY_DN5943_c0_g1_i1:120-1004(-)